MIVKKGTAPSIRKKDIKKKKETVRGVEDRNALLDLV